MPNPSLFVADDHGQTTNYLANNNHHGQPATHAQGHPHQAASFTVGSLTVSVSPHPSPLGEGSPAIPPQVKLEPVSPTMPNVAAHPGPGGAMAVDPQHHPVDEAAVHHPVAEAAVHHHGDPNGGTEVPGESYYDLYNNYHRDLVAASLAFSARPSAIFYGGPAMRPSSSAGTNVGSAPPLAPFPRTPTQPGRQTHSSQLNLSDNFGNSYIVTESRSDQFGFYGANVEHECHGYLPDPTPGDLATDEPSPRFPMPPPMFPFDRQDDNPTQTHAAGPAAAASTTAPGGSGHPADLPLNDLIKIIEDKARLVNQTEAGLLLTKKRLGEKETILLIKEDDLRVREVMMDLKRKKLHKDRKALAEKKEQMNAEQRNAQGQADHAEAQTHDGNPEEEVDAPLGGNQPPEHPVSDLNEEICSLRSMNDTLTNEVSILLHHVSYKTAENKDQVERLEQTHMEASLQHENLYRQLEKKRLIDIEQLNSIIAHLQAELLQQSCDRVKEADLKERINSLAVIRVKEREHWQSFLNHLVNQYGEQSAIRIGVFEKQIQELVQSGEAQLRQEHQKQAALKEQLAFTKQQLTNLTDQLQHYESPPADIERREMNLGLQPECPLRRWDKAIDAIKSDDLMRRVSLLDDCKKAVESQNALYSGLVHGSPGPHQAELQLYRLELNSLPTPRPTQPSEQQEQPDSANNSSPHAGDATSLSQPLDSPGSGFAYQLGESRRCEDIPKSGVFEYEEDTDYEEDSEDDDNDSDWLDVADYHLFFPRDGADEEDRSPPPNPQRLYDVQVNERLCAQNQRFYPFRRLIALPSPSPPAQNAPLPDLRRPDDEDDVRPAEESRPRKRRRDFHDSEDSDDVRLPPGSNPAAPFARMHNDDDDEDSRPSRPFKKRRDNENRAIGLPSSALRSPSPRPAAYPASERVTDAGRIRPRRSSQPTTRRSVLDSDEE